MLFSLYELEKRVSSAILLCLVVLLIGLEGKYWDLSELCVLSLFFLVRYHWQNWILKNSWKMLSTYTALRIWNWIVKKQTEVRNWEPEEPCRRNTHQRNITAFCCCCGPREEMRAARQGLCPAGQTPAPPSQESFVSSYDVLAYFWNKRAQHHLSSSSFTLWFISACPRWVSNAFMLSMFFPTLANPGPVCEGVKRTVTNDNVLCETFASCKFPLFSKNK